MTIQTNVTVDAVVAAEVTLGVAPAVNVAGARIIRRVSTTLNTGKDAYTSAEVRSDQQIADMRHGTKRASGSIEGELSIASYDPEIEAGMRGTFATGATTTQVALGGVVAAASALTFTTGDPVALGFRVGDVVRLTGAAVDILNRNVNFRITGFSGTTSRVVAVSPAPTAMASVATYGFAVPGKKVGNGVVKRSFTIEQRYPDLGISELFVGMRVGALAFRLPPTGLATLSIEFQGVDGTLLKGAAAPYFTGPTAQGTTGVLAAVNGALRVRGQDRAIITGLDFSINLGLSSTPVVGSDTVPEIFYGRTVVTGNISAFFDSAELVEAFLNEEEFDIVSVFEAAGVAPRDFLAFSIQRAKFTGNSKSIGADGGVILSLPFQALLRTAAPGFDATTMAIQSSIV